MRIGVGLPNTIPGTPGPRLIDWAREAESMGFTTLATIGRLVFPTYEELQALSAAAAVTERIELFSNVTIGPVYDPAILAKMAAGVDQLSNGRFVLGLAPGWRDEDYHVVGRSFADRGRQLDRLVEYLQRAWRGELVEGATKKLTPVPTNGDAVPIAFGGTVDRAFERAATHGIGWTAGGETPEDTTRYNEQARAAWQAAGRSGQPRLWALMYYSLGEGARERAATYLTDYYGEYGDAMAASLPADAEAIRATVDAFEVTGTDTLVFDPVSSDMRQLEMLADALGDRLRIDEAVAA